MKRKTKTKKVKRKRRKHSSKLTTTQNRLDRKWSLLVRAVGECEVCGKTNRLNAHHLIGRGDLKCRWNLDNGVCLCVSCHRFNRFLSAHGAVGSSMVAVHRFLNWLEKNKPDQWRWYLDNMDKIVAPKNVDYDYWETYLDSNELPGF